MQTFLPYPCYKYSAECLDYRRLGKQRVEAWQIIQILEGRQSHWENHPAVKMWRCCPNGLINYYNVILSEWINRGYNNNMKFIPIGSIEHPVWFGWEKFHSLHRANLLLKNPEWYSQFNWIEQPQKGYIWPVNV